MSKSTILSASLALLLGCGLSQGGSSGPTYHRDVRPIIEQRCGGCHAADGVGGLVLDGSPAITPLMMSKIDNGSMPPWPPSPLTPSLVADRKLLPSELEILRSWAAAGSPAGNPSDYRSSTPRSTPEPSVTLKITAAFHPAKGQADQYRCFVLSGLTGGWITAAKWQIGHPAAVHHIGGITVDAAGLELLRSRGLTGPAGWDCPGDFGPAPAIAGLSSTGVGDPGLELPPGVGIAAPIGGAIVMQVHYVPAAVPATGDVSGVSLWLEPEPKRAVTEFQMVAPVEVPCALGVSPSPANRCSRQYAFDHDSLRNPSLARAESDAALTSCGQTLAAYYQRLPWQTVPEASFMVSTSCAQAIPVSGDLLGVHLHMHTRGKSGRIEVRQPDGSWLIVLDIPKWRWPWEQGYLLQKPVRVQAGQLMRVSCEIDNGTAAQWGLGGPGHDAPATPPLDLPAYRIGGTARETEMCAAFLQIVLQ